MLRSYQVSPAVVFNILFIVNLPPRFHYEWRDEASDLERLDCVQVGRPVHSRYNLCCHLVSPINHHGTVIPNLAKSLFAVGRCSRSTAAKIDTWQGLQSTHWRRVPSEACSTEMSRVYCGECHVMFLIFLVELRTRRSGVYGAATARSIILMMTRISVWLSVSIAVADIQNGRGWCDRSNR